MGALRSWFGSGGTSGLEVEKLRASLRSVESKREVAERDRNNGWALLTTIHQLLNMAHRGKCRVEWDDNGNFCLHAESEDGTFTAQFKSEV